MHNNLIFFNTSFAPNSFGSPMDGRAFIGEKYRFGFNGQEKDDEVKGEGNSLDFGARIYDSRLGRWLSLDPLMAKYPSMSPYNFCANNPIKFVDYDGKDFGVVINHATKTITIVSTVYTVKENITAVDAGANFWNGQSGKFSYVDGGSGKEYKINFAVNVIIEKSEVAAKDNALSDPNGNFMLSKEDNYKQFTATDGSVIKGFVAGGQAGSIREEYEHTNTMFHEFGHFFGIFEWKKGIMAEGTRKTNEITKGILQNIFSNALIDTGPLDGGNNDCPSDVGRENNRLQKAAGTRQAQCNSSEIGCDEGFSGSGKIIKNETK